MKGRNNVPRISLTDEQKQKEKLARRMDKFDSVVVEYMRSTGNTTDDLANKLGVSKSTLWRYRTQTESFSKAPFDVISSALRLANCSNETLRFICGL